MTPKRVTCIYPFFWKLKWGFVCDVTKMHLFSDHFFSIFGMRLLKKLGLKRSSFCKKKCRVQQWFVVGSFFSHKEFTFSNKLGCKKVNFTIFCIQKKQSFFLVILVTTKSRVGLVQKSSSFAMSITRMVVHTFMFYQKRL